MAEEAEHQEEQQVEQQVEFDYESAAKDMGWDPDYQGPGKKSAKEFYERGMEIQPILQKNLERFRQQNHSLEAKLDRQQREFKKSLDILTRHHNAELERKIDEIKAQKAQAVSDADHDKYEKLEKQEEKLRKQAEAKQEPDEVPDAMDDPQVQEWVSRNPWVNNDPELAAYAQFYGQFVSTTRGLKGVALLSEVEKGVKEKYPSKFTNSRRSQPSPSGPKPPPADKKEKGWDALPAEAKQAWKEINSYAGVEMSKEEYAKEYFEMEDE